MKNCQNEGKMTDICRRLYEYARLDDRMAELEQRMTDLEGVMTDTKNTNSYFNLEHIEMKMKVLYNCFTMVHDEEVTKKSALLIAEVDALIKSRKDDLPWIKD